MERQQAGSQISDRRRGTNEEIATIKTRLMQLAEDIALIHANVHKIEEKITTVESRIDRLVVESIELKRGRPI